MPADISGESRLDSLDVAVENKRIIFRIKLHVFTLSVRSMAPIQQTFMSLTP
jgi:hypothetical protein